MTKWITGAILLLCALASRSSAQYAFGVQGGPLFFDGMSEVAAKSLDHTRGFTIGAQLLEGAVGGTGFRAGLDLCFRSYDLQARDQLGSRMERLSVTSTLLQFSSEVRWPLNDDIGVYFDFGPVIGAEIHEKRSGVSYYTDTQASMADTIRYDGETESGFVIRDIRLRIGLSGMFPLSDGWSLTAGMHISPGVTTWAREHGYGTLDGQLRVGLTRLIGKGATHGAVRHGD
jgi:hypothetical protein